MSQLSQLGAAKAAFIINHPDGCRRDRGGASWWDVCIHVAMQHALAIVDDLNYEGSILCPFRDVTLPNEITDVELMDDFVRICAQCCRLGARLPVKVGLENSSRREMTHHERTI